MMVCVCLCQDSVEKKGLATIYAFVEAGKDYLQKLSKAMLGLLYHTPFSHRDHTYLPGLVEGQLLVLTGFLGDDFSAHPLFS